MRVGVLKEENSAVFKLIIIEVDMQSNPLVPAGGALSNWPVDSLFLAQSHEK